MKKILTKRGKEIYENNVRKIAYELWQKAGEPEGRDWELWFAAQKESTKGLWKSKSKLCN